MIAFYYINAVCRGWGESSIRSAPLFICEIFLYEWVPLMMGHRLHRCLQGLMDHRLHPNWQTPLPIQQLCSGPFLEYFWSICNIHENNSNIENQCKLQWKCNKHSDKSGHLPSKANMAMSFTNFGFFHLIYNLKWATVLDAMLLKYPPFDEVA